MSDGDGAVRSRSRSNQGLPVAKQVSGPWVIISGGVYDLAPLIDVHPGGRDVLIEANGTDATVVFEGAGHSARARKRLETFRKADYVDNATDGLPIGVPLEEPVQQKGTETFSGWPDQKSVVPPPDHGAMWHSARREAMLREHPELEDMQGHNPWSILVAGVGVAVHTSCAIYCLSHPGLLVLFALAWSVGATCRMGAFAMSHEFCHGTVSPRLLELRARRWCIGLTCLPSCGNGIYEYYAHHHMTHHSILGTQDVITAWRGFFGSQDSDGDMFHPYVLLLTNRWLKRDQTEAQCAAAAKLAQCLGRFLPKPFATCWRLAVDSFLHLGHLGVMTLWSAALGCMCAGAVGLSVICQGVLCVIRFGKQRQAAIKMAPRFKRVLDIGSQSWLSLIAFAALVLVPPQPPDGRLWGVARVLAYLGLSELFLNGFLLHPYGAYFLGVHHSARGVGPLPPASPSNGAAEKTTCQPTRSCYASPLFSLLTWNLTYHVEHHDLPGVPWSRLPEVRAAAPEFYEHLATTSSPLQTLSSYYLDNDGSWEYACTLSLAQLQPGQASGEA